MFLEISANVIWELNRDRDRISGSDAPSAKNIFIFIAVNATLHILLERYVVGTHLSKNILLLTG